MSVRLPSFADAEGNLGLNDLLLTKSLTKEYICVNLLVKGGYS